MGPPADRAGREHRVREEEQAELHGRVAANPSTRNGMSRPEETRTAETIPVTTGNAPTSTRRARVVPSARCLPAPALRARAEDDRQRTARTTRQPRRGPKQRQEADHAEGGARAGEVRELLPRPPGARTAAGPPRARSARGPRARARGRQEQLVRERGGVGAHVVGLGARRWLAPAPATATALGWPSSEAWHGGHREHPARDARGRRLPREMSTRPRRGTPTGRERMIAALADPMLEAVPPRLGPRGRRRGHRRARPPTGRRGLVPAVHRRAAGVRVRRREDAGARHRRRSAPPPQRDRRDPVASLMVRRARTATRRCRCRSRCTTGHG